MKRREKSIERSVEKQLIRDFSTLRRLSNPSSEFKYLIFRRQQQTAGFEKSHWDIDYA